MKYLRALSISFLIFMVNGCVGSGVKTAHRDPNDLIKAINGSTVALVGQPFDKVLPYCTGVWISNTMILTAAHCIDAAASIDAIKHMKNKDESMMYIPTYYIVENDVEQVGDDPSVVRLGRSWAVDLEHDLALVQARGNNIPAHKFVRVADVMPGIGEQIHVVGQVKGLYWSYVTGVVSAYRDDLPESRKPDGWVGPFMQISAPVYFGNSGGGAFDNNGDLVGICSFLGGAPNTTMFIPTGPIKALLKANDLL